VQLVVQWCLVFGVRCLVGQKWSRINQEADEASMAGGDGRSSRHFIAFLSISSTRPKPPHPKPPTHPPPIPVYTCNNLTMGKIRQRNSKINKGKNSVCENLALIERFSVTLINPCEYEDV